MSVLSPSYPPSWDRGPGLPVLNPGLTGSVLQRDPGIGLGPYPHALTDDRVLDASGDPTRTASSESSPWDVGPRKPLSVGDH